MNTLAKSFSVKWENFELPEKGCYDSNLKIGSTLYFYMKNALCIPDNHFLHQLQQQKVSEAGNEIRAYQHMPEPFRSLPDDFYKSLEESESDYDKNAIISMWDSIGIKLSFKQHDAPTISTVLNETSDIILAPVIASNPDLTAFSVKICVISNSGINIEKPTTAVIGNTWPFRWSEPATNIIWTANDKEKPSATEPFQMKFRLLVAEIKPDLQSILLALAHSLASGGNSVKCCRRMTPELRSAHKYNKNIMPKYEWYDFDPNSEVPIDPIEPEIVRDFVENGDRNIRLSGWKKSALSKIENDPHYMVVKR